VVSWLNDTIEGSDQLYQPPVSLIPLSPPLTKGDIRRILGDTPNPSAEGPPEGDPSGLPDSGERIV